MTEPGPSRSSPAAGVPASSSSDPVRALEFETFYRETVKPLVGFLILQGVSMVDAADIAQDTLCSAFERWPSLQNPRAWSFRVASRALIHRSITDTYDPASPAALNPLLRANPTDAWHFRHDLITALAELPRRQRQVMAWRLSGYTPEEIATELQMTNDAVRSNLYLARRRLTARLQGGEETP